MFKVTTCVLVTSVFATTVVAAQFEHTKGSQQEPDDAKVAEKQKPKSFSPTRFNLTVYGGQGLIRAASPYTLKEGELAAGGYAMNFDRHPGDIDFFEFSLQVALGLPKNSEIFFRLTPTLRNDAVALHPTGYPVPPLDLFIDTYPNDATRAGPILMFAQETPYKTYRVRDVNITPPGNGAFASSTGDASIGGKINLLSEDRGDRLGFGIRGSLDIATERPHYNSAIASEWREKAGFAGETNFRLDFAFAKKFWITELLVNAGYKWVGSPDRGVRVQHIDSSKVGTDEFLVGEVVESGLDLHDFLILNGGLSLPAFKVLDYQVWLMAELGYTRYVGGGTPVERLVHPLEMRLGLQFNFPWYPNISFGMGWQLLFNDAGDGDLRSSALLTPDGRGDVNFGELVDEDLSAEVQAFLTSQGATFSENSSKVLSSNNATFNSWRNVPTEPWTIVGQGGGNIHAYITWRAGKLW